MWVYVYLYCKGDVGGEQVLWVELLEFVWLYYEDILCWGEVLLFDLCEQFFYLMVVFFLFEIEVVLSGIIEWVLVGLLLVNVVQVQ